MAIDFFNTYPQNTGAKSEDYPFGSFRNETAPNAEDGTTLEERWSNDWLAFFSRLLVEASMTPSGEVDTVKVSQYYDALLAIIQREKVEVSNSLNGTRTDVAASEDALRRTHELASSKVSKSGDTMTGKLTILNNVPAIDLRNSTIPANNVGARSILHNIAGNTVLSLTNEEWNQEFRQVFPRKSGTIALEQDLFGAGQKWVDVTGQRTLGSNYTNNTSRPIEVIVGAADTSSRDAIVIVNVGGVDITRYHYDRPSFACEAVVTFTVPAGSTYSVRTGASIFGITKWAELR